MSRKFGPGKRSPGERHLGKVHRRVRGLPRLPGYSTQRRRKEVRMINRQRNLGWGGLGVLAVLVVCCLPDKAPAETLVFRNECKAPVVVQAASVVRGVLRRDRPYLLNYRDTTPDIVMPGNKLITVYDAKV